MLYFVVARETLAAPKPPPPKHHAPGVRGQFDAAQALFESGRFGDAVTAFLALLRKYPAYEPAQIQLAKAYYRLDRLKDANAVFSRINVAHLDPETSYEFAWSYYMGKGYEGALAGFQRVPKGHALYDLANYYGGISALKLKRYEVAEDMLERAVVLPDKLAKSRSLYIKHVQALRLMQQKNALSQDLKRENDTLQSQRRLKREEAKAAQTANEPKEYKHQGFLEVKKSATISHTVKRQTVDMHQYKEQAFDARTTKFDLLSGWLQPLPLKLPGGRQAAFGLQVSLGAEDRITHGTEQQPFTQRTQEDLTRLLNKKLNATDVKSGKVGVLSWFEAPLPENIWLGIGAELNFVYPEFSRGGRTGNRRGYFDVNGKTGVLTYGAESSYNEILDSKTKPTTTIVEGTGKISGDIATKLTMTGKATYDQYTYLDDTLALDGPDQITAGEVDLVQALPLNFSLEVDGIYQYQVNHLFHQIPSFDEVAADGQTYSLKVIGKVVPLPWLTLSVSELVTKTQWKLLTEVARDPFEIATPSYSEDLQATVGVSLGF